MPKIKLNLSKLTVPEKLAKAEQIVLKMTGNANFPTPSPSLVSITTAANELKTAFAEAQAARQTQKEKTAAQNAKEELLDQLLTQEAAFVESVAGNDEQIILSAGMDVRAAAVASTTPPEQPQALAPFAGDRDGEIDLSWDRVPGAKSYIIEKTADPQAAAWQHAGVATKATFTADGLTSGSRFWFRVAAVNNNGQSGWSDIAVKIAP
jgi:hypothetical protein